MPAPIMVKCLYCGESLERDSEVCVKVNSRRYAHKTCAEGSERILSAEERDLEALEKYIENLLEIQCLTPKIKRQIKEYTELYNYTFSGMLKALIYHYEICNGDVSKAGGGIGIIPYVYNRAHDYYYSMWLSQQNNKDKDINDYIPKKVTITIPIPQPRRKKIKLFNLE